MEKIKLVGTFKNNKSFGFVVPDNKKESKDIFISKKYFSGAKNDDKVVVEITKPEENGKKPEGKIVEVIGNIDVAGVDMLSIIKQYNLPYEFPKLVLDEAKKMPKEVSEDEIKGRRDFRAETVFTIDSEDAKDLDDAVSVEKNKKRNIYIKSSYCRCKPLCKSK